MPQPILLPTSQPNGEGPGLAYRLEGESIPALHLALNGQMPIFFEHHVLFWKEPRLNIGNHPLRKGLAKRLLGGLPVYMLSAEGAGQLALGQDQPGQIVPLHLAAGSSILAREHQFLAATANLDYDYAAVQGWSNRLLGGSGIFIDRFMASSGDGIVWIHAFGNVFEVELAPGEVIDVEPHRWVYREESVGMEPQRLSLKTSLFAGQGYLYFNRFSGPGRVGLQTGTLASFANPEVGASQGQFPGQGGGFGDNSGDMNAGSLAGGLGGSILGGLFGN